MDEKDFEKKSTKKVTTIVGIIIIALIIAIILGGFFYLKFTRKPERIFAKEIDKLFKMEENKNSKQEKFELDITASIDSDNEEIKMIDSFLKGIKLKVNLETDLNNKVFCETLIPSFIGQEIVSLDILLQDDNLYAYSEELYDKYIELPKEYIETPVISIDTVFEELSEQYNTLTNEKLINNIKNIYHDSIKIGTFSQEKVKLNGATVLKTTKKMSAKEYTDISNRILKEIDNNNNDETIKIFTEELKNITEEIENYSENVEISIYTKGITNKFEKAEIIIINKYGSRTFEFEKKEKEKEIQLRLLQDNSAEGINSEEVFNITIKEEEENSRTVKFKINIDGTIITLNIKCTNDYNAKPEKRDTSNSIELENLTEIDYLKIYSNIQKNEILYSIINTISEMIEAL